MSGGAVSGELPDRVDEFPVGTIVLGFTVVAVFTRSVLWTVERSPLASGIDDVLVFHSDIVLVRPVFVVVGALYFVVALHVLARALGGSGGLAGTANVVPWGFAPWAALLVVSTSIIIAQLLADPIPAVVFGFPDLWLGRSLLAFGRLAALTVAAIVWHRGLVDVHGLEPRTAGLAVCVAIAPVAVVTLLMDADALVGVLGLLVG